MRIKHILCLLLCATVMSALFAVPVSAESSEYTISNGILTKYNGDGGDITVPDGVTTIGTGAFEFCKNLTSVIISSSVTSIGKAAFQGCSSLKSVTIPDGVTSIGNQAFKNTALTSIAIPDSVKSIGGYAFFEAENSGENFTNISVSKGNSKYSSKDGVLFNKKKTELIQYPTGSKKANYTVPQGVTKIDEWAIGNCTTLKFISIPRSVKSIGNWALNNCTSLTNILVDQNNAKYSSKYGVLFNKNKTVLLQYPSGSRLTAYTVQTSVKSIYKNSFRDAAYLTSIAIPNSVTSIGQGAFESCTRLVSVTIPGSVASIQTNTFCGCTGLKSIVIPKSVKIFGGNAFSQCVSLTIYCFSGSATETYAKKHKLKYAILQS